MPNSFIQVIQVLHISTISAAIALLDYPVFCIDDKDDDNDHSSVALATEFCNFNLSLWLFISSDSFYHPIVDNHYDVCVLHHSPVA